MRVNCIRERLNADGSVAKQWTEQHVVELRWYDGPLSGLWVYLEPGVTGYESAKMEALVSCEGGWLACAGTPEEIDRLIVPPEEMDRVRDVLRLSAVRRC